MPWIMAYMPEWSKFLVLSRNQWRWCKSGSRLYVRSRATLHLLLRSALPYNVGDLGGPTFRFMDCLLKSTFNNACTFLQSRWCFAWKQTVPFQGFLLGKLQCNAHYSLSVYLWSSFDIFVHLLWSFVLEVLLRGLSFSSFFRLHIHSTFPILIFDLKYLQELTPSSNAIASSQ